MPENLPLVFLLAGQSNMVGRAPAATLPEEYRSPPPMVTLFEDGRPGPLVPRTGQIAGSDARGRADEFGPEISFGHCLTRALPGRPILLVKHAYGGSRIAQWNPDEPQSFYHELLEQYRLATANRPHRLGAALWLQGGSDSLQEEDARAYADRLTHLILRLRADLDALRLPFLIAQSWPPEELDERTRQRYRFQQMICDAKARVSATVSAAPLVSTSGLTMRPDGIHLDGPSLGEMGCRFFEAIVKMSRPVV